MKYRAFPNLLSTFSALLPGFPLSQSYLCVSELPPLYLLNAPCSFQTTWVLHIFSFLEMPFSSLLHSHRNLNPLGLLNKGVPHPPPNTVSHSFLPALTASVHLPLGTYLTGLFIYGYVSSNRWSTFQGHGLILLISEPSAHSMVFDTWQTLNT